MLFNIKKKRLKNSTETKRFFDTHYRTLCYIVKLCLFHSVYKYITFQYIIRVDNASMDVDTNVCQKHSPRRCIRWSLSRELLRFVRTAGTDACGFEVLRYTCPRAAAISWPGTSASVRCPEVWRHWKALLSRRSVSSVNTSLAIRMLTI